MISDEEVSSFLEHHGIIGQKWGVRRNETTGVRPIAKTLSRSKFGKLSQKNVDRHNRQKSQGKMSTSEKAAIGLAVTAVGALLVSHMLKQNGGIKLGLIPKQPTAYSPNFYGESARKLVRRAGVGEAQRVGSGVHRVGGAIPMPAGRMLKIHGATKLKDIPKGSKVPSELVPRVNAIRDSLKKQGSISNLIPKYKGPNG